MPLSTKALVDREVIYCASTLVWELSQRLDCLDAEDVEILIDLGTSSRDYEEPARDAGWEPVDDPTWMVFSNGTELRVFRDGTESQAWEQIMKDEGYSPADYGDADDENLTPEIICAEKEGWERLDNVTFFNLDTNETSEADDWEDLGAEQGIEPYEREAYEHWIVSNWLGEHLEEKGETVRELMGLTLWARGTTGQAVYMDGVIQEIAGDLNLA